MAFDAGYEAGAEDAGSGELLVEALALQSAFYDLDGKTRRAIALDELETAVSVETWSTRRIAGAGFAGRWLILRDGGHPAAALC